jgi:outer membrane protein assembly factor BamC
MLKKATKARYALPIIDKYRVRIEPTDNGKKTEVHFTLNSMEEVIDLKKLFAKLHTASTFLSITIQRI